MEYKKDRNPFEDEPFLHNIRYLLVKWFRSNIHKSRFSILEDLLKKFLPNLASIKVDIDEMEDAKDVIFIEKDANNELLEGVIFKDLATGYRNIINIVGNIIIRSMPKVNTEFGLIAMAHNLAKWLVLATQEKIDAFFTSQMTIMIAQMNLICQFLAHIALSFKKKLLLQISPYLIQKRDCPFWTASFLFGIYFCLLCSTFSSYICVISINPQI